ncbi:ubiquitin domain-containing protein DSK2b-like isoform X2 [Durio zibethinus]|uniref:Ubiquitin domain-containing protein DSK2b-like isoform X2 n=1 Tax=Durio zibethinus TaxID=66656 RepID=A0A6P5ZGB1_DURZI|nr:ubiquitin domain-containing protein DSK2b-like isoform X2 [Durio zibethinus]
MRGGDNSAATEEVSQTNAGDGVTINIRCSNGSKFSLQINLDSTVDSFKTVLARNCDIPADHQRLIYKGRILKDDQTLQSYGLEADHTVHLVRGFGLPPTTNAAGSISSGASNTAQTNTSAVGSDEAGALGAGGAGLGASLLPGLGLGGLGGSAGLLGAGLPDFEQVQQQLTRNPNFMREIMNMPAVQNIMNNPEIMQNLIMNNPQMREIIDRNPELAHILNDPSTLSQTLEAARNPELMREMMRNTDRAMSNIESSPEGFNMLRRMYETVQEPFLNATTMAGSTGHDSSNPFAALLGSQGGNQGGDGSTNQSTPTSGTSTNSPAPNTNPLPNPWSSAATGGAQTNTTNSNHSVDARPRAPAGLGGLGLPEFEGMFGAMQDSNLLNQLMQNPAISQMMQSLLSNPQYMNQVLGLNPQLQSMLDSNSQLGEMTQNPEFLRQLTSPETTQQLLTLWQSLLSELSRPQSTQEPAQTGGAAGIFRNAQQHGVGSTDDHVWRTWGWQLGCS